MIHLIPRHHRLKAADWTALERAIAKDHMLHAPRTIAVRVVEVLRRRGFMVTVTKRRGTP